MRFRRCTSITEIGRFVVGGRMLIVSKWLHYICGFSKMRFLQWGISSFQLSICLQNTSEVLEKYQEMQIRNMKMLILFYIWGPRSLFGTFEKLQISHPRNRYGYYIVTVIQNGGINVLEKRHCFSCTFINLHSH